MPKKSYAQEARVLIAKVTGYSDPLKALNALSQMVRGPETFVRLVESAMFQAADAEAKRIKAIKKEVKDD